MQSQQIDLMTLVTALQNLTQSSNAGSAAITAAIVAAFPQADASVEATATAGAGTLPATPEAFLAITVDGTSYRVPLYLPS